MPKATIIISTYNQPEWLRKCLWGYVKQDADNFEIIIADDGSTNETEHVISEFLSNSKFKITHLWQKDDGFRKNKILNKAIQKSNSGYLIFTDGDCIPRKDFISTHLGMKKGNSFLSGGYFKLPVSISNDITKEDIEHQKCFNPKWLLNKGLKKTFKLNKLTSSSIKERLLNKFTPTKATWDGMNVSGFKKDIVAVNGYDERMGYGGEDRELGERLMNIGIRPIQIRYSAICLHLYHERGYSNSEVWKLNNSIRKRTKKLKSTWTDFGIMKLD